MTDTASIPASIERGHVYPLAVFQRITQLRAWAMRTLRKRGLRVHIVGGRTFVSGDDFFDYLQRQTSQEGQP